MHEIIATTEARISEPRIQAAQRRPVYRDVILNTFHPDERQMIRALEPTQRVALAEMLPPDASMSLLLQSLHEAHRVLQPPSTIAGRVAGLLSAAADGIRSSLSPKSKTASALRLEHAQTHAAIAHDLLDTHGKRMEADDHHPDFANRLPPDQSVLMQMLAHVLHADEETWQAAIDALFVQLEHAAPALPSWQTGVQPARLLMSELHVTAHRASDQARFVSGNASVAMDAKAMKRLQQAGARLGTLCLRLEQWKRIDYAHVKKNFHTGMMLNNHFGNWH